MRSTDAFRAPTSRTDGYTLAGLLVVLIVLEVAIAAALPLWSAAAQRDREEEMIFRGLQYAEAIRLFQERHGRLPVGLKEIVETKEPRILRQAWINPIEENDGWLPLLQQQGVPQGGAGGGEQTGLGTVNLQRGGQRPQRVTPRESSVRNGSGGQMGRQNRRGNNQSGEPEAPFLGGEADDVKDNQYGPFTGVKPGSSGESMMVYFGAEDYSEWEFAAEHLIRPPSPDGRILAPRLWTQRFWVPLPGTGFESGGDAQPGGLPRSN